MTGTFLRMPLLDELLEASHREFALPFRVERTIDFEVVLSFEAGGKEKLQQIRWPVKLLPDNIQIGDIIWLRASTSGSRDAEKKEILNKVLDELIT